MSVLDALLDARRDLDLRESFAQPTATSAVPAAQARMKSEGRRRVYAQRTTTRSGVWDESKHPRGTKGSSTGGKFVAKGASGDDVRAVQARVGAKQDGQFGNLTRKAVMDFQKKHGLKVDGVVGRQTATAIAGRYREARRTAPGALRRSDRTQLRRSAPSRSRKPRAPQRTSGGYLI